MHFMQLSEKLSIILSRKKLTQEQLGRAVGINQTTVGRWLKNETKPYERIARQLADYLGISYEELTDDDKGLPMQIFAEGLKRAATKATAAFPENQEAAQLFFDANVSEMHEREKAFLLAQKIREHARGLREQANGLSSLADSIEAPFKEKPQTNEPEETPAAMRARLLREARATASAMIRQEVLDAATHSSRQPSKKQTTLQP